MALATLNYVIYNVAFIKLDAEDIGYQHILFQMDVHFQTTGQNKSLPFFTNAECQISTNISQANYFRKHLNIFTCYIIVMHNWCRWLKFGPIDRELVYLAQSIPWLLVSWWIKEPEHQHVLSSYPWIFCFQHQGWSLLKIHPLISQSWKIFT